MATRLGKKTIQLHSMPKIIGNAAAVGKKEGDGPLKSEFDLIFNDTSMGEESWEKAESDILKATLGRAVANAHLKMEDIDAVFSGDLLNQCIGSTFALRELSVPLCTVYGACSTMALSLCCACLAIESGGFSNVAAATCSHFCSAERQFRHPLEYGGQRTPTAQWTVTGSGALVLSDSKTASLPFVDKIHFGTIRDLGITDPNNMGAAMAPAAKQTIVDFLRDTGTEPSDYDLILTGDLGLVGSQLLCELAKKEDGIDLSAVHDDCGLMIFDREKADVHSGGSGCGCSASVLCSHIINSMRDSKLKNVLFVATGALLSTTSSLQGESIPGIAHAVNIKIQ